MNAHPDLTVAGSVRIVSGAKVAVLDRDFPTGTVLYAGSPKGTDCTRCFGAGAVETGDMHPWGEPMMQPCGCR